MLTIRAATSPGYYERAEFARDDYYAEPGAAPGRWVGRGAEALGLSDAPRRGDLEALLEGLHPRDGEPLSRSPFRRTNAGFDLTFTAPKSMSVLAAVGDPAIRQAVIAAHEAGVAAGLDYLERHECQARRGAGGQRIIGAQGLAGAAYTHELSRAGDPHLHTHVVIANLVRGADGRMSAPDMRPVFAAAKTAGTIAESVTRQELTRSLGVEWGPLERGSAEIDGIPQEVLEHFSSRWLEIAELAHARGASSLRAVGAIQRETRDRRPDLDRDQARDNWLARAAEHGLDRATLARALGRQASVELSERELAEVFERLAGPGGLTQRESTFSRRDVVRAVAEAHPQGAAHETIEQLADAFLAARGISVEPAGTERGVRERFSVDDLLQAERRLLALAAEVEPLMAIQPVSVEGALAARPWLGADQAAAVAHLAGGENRIRLLEARAGRGKTAALAALADAYRADGIAVVGTAWQGEAARTLEVDAGIASQTAARLLWGVARDPGHLRLGAVLVVDEASAMPTRALVSLAEAVAARDGRLVLVGDRAQLPPIDAGGAFASLADRLGAAELSENRRQRDPLQSRVADLLGDGRATEAIGLLRESGRLQAFPASEDARAQLMGDWARAALPDPSPALIVAHDRADVAALNTAAREQMERAGLLGPTRLVVDGREWAAGDRLVCRRNDYRPEVDVRNGTRGTVERIDHERRSLILRTDDGRRVELPADYLEHARHGYAVTGHASQGATVDRTFLLASPERGSAEWGYVVGSRHRLDLRVYVSGEHRDGAAEALGRAWGRRQAKGLAIDRLACSGATREPIRAVEPPAARTTADLWAEREALVARLRTEDPGDLAPALGPLEAERALVERELREARWRGARAADRLDGLAQWTRLTRRGRDEARDLSLIATEAERAAGRAETRLRGLAREIASARGDTAARETWDRGTGAWLRQQIERLDAQVERRVSARAKEVERAAPAYIVQTLGPRPEKRADLDRWREGVRLIEGYRERFGIDDAVRALGGEPRDLNQRLEQRELHRVLEREVGRDLSLGPGLER